MAAKASARCRSRAATRSLFDVRSYARRFRPRRALAWLALAAAVFAVVSLLASSRRPPADAERYLSSLLFLPIVEPAISLVAPFLSGADAATTIALLGLHLVAAAVMIPVLTRNLRGRTW